MDGHEHHENKRVTRGLEAGASELESLERERMPASRLTGFPHAMHGWDRFPVALWALVGNYVPRANAAQR